MKRFSYSRGKISGQIETTKYAGLLRPLILKKRTLSTLNTDKLKIILNSRPLNQLDTKAQYGVFHQSLTRVALRA